MIEQEQIVRTVVELELENIASLVQKALDSGEEPSKVLEWMCDGMQEVGRLFESGEYYLADLVLAGEVMKEGLEILKPHLKAGEATAKGKVIMCTVKGDIHDIGKNLVCTMLSSSGFEVIDLGVDVPPEKVVEAVRESGARAIGLSVLITPMIQSIGDVVEALKNEGLREKVKIAIGGACTTEELVERMGVDALGRDAVEAVRIFESFLAS